MNLFAAKCPVVTAILAVIAEVEQAAEMEAEAAVVDPALEAYHPPP